MISFIKMFPFRLMNQMNHARYIYRIVTVVFLLFACSQLGFPVAAQTRQRASRKKPSSQDSRLVPPEVAVPSGPRLREIAPSGGKFSLLVGGSISAPLLGSPAETILNREFRFITPANAFKQTSIHPKPRKWNWKKADMWVDRCEERGEIMRLHACVSPQCSAWAEEDSRTPAELQQVMEEYVESVCKRYNDRKHVRWIDVVNETVTRKGEWFGPRPGVGKWQNPWTQIGFDESHPLRPPLYIKRAFEIAGEHAPNIKLLFNQHGGMEPEAWRKVRATVLYLREKGIRIDGIGWQCHIDSGFEKDPKNMQRLNTLIQWAHGNELEFHITENTVWMRDGETPTDLNAQADTYAAIIRTLLSHSKNGVVTWNVWQMRDTDTQRNGLMGTLFDKGGRPKPSYYAVQQELLKFKE
jgi:endo-1,4-beta-xylanase